MKIFKKTMMACMAVLMGTSITSCGDANEYEDARTDNPSWVDHYNDTLSISHPETLANTKWVRGTGLKVNAYGEEVQGFVESLDFVSADSVAVKMSQGATEGTWDVDDSNSEQVPYYEYTYSSRTGVLEIKKVVYTDKGRDTPTIFTGVAVSEKREVLTILHYGDTPAQTYLVKQ